jgi:tripartite ATP-independent transporter DctM subunit
MNSNSVGILILMGSFMALMLMKLPIAFALGVASLLTAWHLGLPMLMIFQRMVNGLNSFTFLAVPFFVVAGQIMTEGGISDRLVRFSNVIIGKVRGGLAMVNVLASMFFGGISGSSVADVSSIGAFLIPMMEKKGYDKDFAVAVTITSSVQGVIIPPSQNVIYYSLAAGGISIGRLFLGGYIPGIILGLSLMVLSYVISVIRGYPKEESFTLKQAAYIVLDSMIGLFTIVIIMGGIIFGLFTATESAAIAIVYAAFVTIFVYRSIGPRGIYRVLKSSIRTLSVIVTIIGTSSAFAFLLAYLRVPRMVTEFLLSFSSNPVVVIILINLIMLFLGTMMDMGILILLLTPILLPVATEIGLDSLQFGIIMMLNLGIGLCTPPVGTSLFVGCAIADLKVEHSIKMLIPFYIVMVLVLILVIAFPQLVLFLPNLVYS